MSSYDVKGIRHEAQEDTIARLREACDDDDLMHKYLNRMLIDAKLRWQCQCGSINSGWQCPTCGKMQWRQEEG